MSRSSWSLIAVGIVLLAGFVALGTWSVGVVQQSMRDTVGQQLRAIHSSDVASLVLWSRRQSDAVGSVATYAARPVRSVMAGTDIEAETEVARRATAAGGFFGFDDFVLTTPQGVVRLSGNAEWPAGQSAGPILIDASDGARRRGTFVSRPFRGPLGERRVAASAAVRGEGGEVIAVLHLLDDPADDLFDVLAVSRPGNTGESYLYSRQGELLSNSRFGSTLLAEGRVTDPTGAGGALAVSLATPGGDLTAPVAAAQRGGIGGEPKVYPSYLGTEVVGVWTWLPELGMGLATEIDRREVFLPAQRLRTTVILLSVLLCLLILGLLAASMLVSELNGRARHARQVAAELGQYQLLGRLGQGAMGTVYKAHHRLLQRPTAVKVLRDPGQARAILRFEREVRLTAELTHPNTVQVYDFGRTEDGRFYYAMEYLPGIDLRALIEVYGRQPSERVAHIISQIAGSLQEAHERGLVHRDIKAANVILCERGGVPDVAKVCDFGLVVAQTDPDAGETGLIGTPIYLAPELVRPPFAPSPRSDLYALGCLAYELLVGRPPFSGTLEQVLQAQLHQLPIAPSLRVAGVHPALDDLILQLLAKAPCDRPVDARTVRRHIDETRCAAAWTPARAARWWTDQDPARVGASQAPETALRIERLTTPGRAAK